MPDSENTPILWYFADPMCSWCWGFSPVIARIKQEYGDRIRLSLNLGGLRPGTREPLGDTQRQEILHHWQQVNKLTGQQFQFDDALPDGFIYDTEPPSRATLVVGRLKPELTLKFFAAVQAAFYQHGLDVTQRNVLAGIAEDFGIGAEEFNALFDSDELREITQQHFRRTRQAGVRAFPTTVFQVGDTVELLASGYVPFEQIAQSIDRHLAVTE